MSDQYTIKHEEYLILVVEDNVYNQQIIYDILTHQSYKVEIVDNGEEALLYLQKKVPDLIILDILMPDMSGLDILKIFRNKIIEDMMPILVVSAIDDIETIIACIENGANDYIIKPINKKLLLARIEASLIKKNYYNKIVDLNKILIAQNAEIQKLEKVKENFINILVHDMNSPIACIKGYAEFLSRVLPAEQDDIKIYEYLKRMGGSILELQSLIDDMLEVPKYEHASYNQLPETFSINNLIQEVLQIFVLIHDDSKRISFENSETDVFVHCDRKVLFKVVNNLILNADKHCTSNPDIKVKLVLAEKDLIIKIKDNGPGIPEEHIERVFDKYFQITEKKHIKKYGHGMGLYFCKKAVESIGGKIWVESKLNEGSVFFIMLPFEKINEAD